MTVVVVGFEPAVAGGPWTGAAEAQGIPRRLRRIRTVRRARHDNTLERFKDPSMESACKGWLLRLPRLDKTSQSVNRMEVTFLTRTKILTRSSVVSDLTL